MSLIINSVECSGISDNIANVIVNTSGVYTNAIIEVAQYDSSNVIIGSWSGVANHSSTGQLVSFSLDPSASSVKFRLYDQSCGSGNTVNFNQYANWNSSELLDPSGNLTTVGSNGKTSFYGTYDQNGQVYEWNDLDNTTGIYRGLRGGSYASPGNDLLSTTRPTLPITEYEGNEVGFRVASDTNPSGYLNFVFVGDSGNSADITGYGSVASEYYLGKYLVTNCAYTQFLNSVAITGDIKGLYNTGMLLDTRGGIEQHESIMQIGGEVSISVYDYSCRANMCEKPVNYVSWFDAARYCNWLHHGKPSGNIDIIEDGAYTLNGTTTGSAPIKNINASYYLPTENQWYKAAYYKGSGIDAGYWTYATQTNIVPSAVLSDVSGNGPITGILDYDCTDDTTEPPGTAGCGLPTWNPDECIEVPFSSNLCIHDDGKLPSPPPSATGTYYLSTGISIFLNVNKEPNSVPEDIVPYYWSGVRLNLVHTDVNTWTITGVIAPSTGVTRWVGQPNQTYTPFTYGDLIGVPVLLTSGNFGSGADRTIFSIFHDSGSGNAINLSIEIPLRYRALYNDYTLETPYTLPVLSDDMGDSSLSGTTSGICTYLPESSGYGSYTFNIGTVTVSMGNTCRSPAVNTCEAPPGPACSPFLALTGADNYGINLNGGRPIDIDVLCDGSRRPIESDLNNIGIDPTGYKFYFVSQGLSAVPVINGTLYDTTWSGVNIITTVHSASTAADMRDWVCNNLIFVSLQDYDDYTDAGGLGSDLKQPVGFVSLSGNSAGITSYSGYYAIYDNWPYNDLYWEVGRCSGMPSGEVPINLVPC